MKEQKNGIKQFPKKARMRKKVALDVLGMTSKDGERLF